MSIETDRQDEAFDLLVSKFPKHFQIKATNYLRGLMKALAVGDGYIATQVESTRDNLIAVTSQGRYLDRNAGRYGIVRGQGAGVLDPDFQKLVPILGLSPKQISHILLRVIDTIYGPFASHANVTAENFEPYDLSDGFNLKVRVDDTVQEVFFKSQDAADLTAATAQELATAISQKTGGRLIGAVLLDARTGKRFLNIRTSTIGTQGFIQVLGGDAQSKLRFPQVRDVAATVTTWDVTRYLGTDEMVFTVSAGTIPDLKAAGVVSGDLVTIRSDSGFLEKNTGNFRVTFVGADYFRVQNGNGLPETGVIPPHTDDFTFYDSTLGNILLTNRPAAVMETSPRELTIILPVTSPIVKRTAKGGHHFHQGLTTAQATTSNTITVASTTGFEASGAIRPMLSRKNSKGTVSSVLSATVTLINGQNWPVQGAFWSASERAFYYYSGRSGDTLTGVSPTPPSSLAGSPISYVERYSYTSISGSDLIGVFPDPTGIENQEICAAGAITGTNFPGGYMYDPRASFIAAEQITELDQTIRQGEVKTLIQVGDVSSFPEKGHFILEFGTGAQEGPIRYLAKVGNAALIVDPGHVYERDHMEGVGLRLVAQIGPYTPKLDGTDYAVYTTSTSPARDLLASYLRLIAASGVKLRFVIRTPEEKWEVLPNLYTTNPLNTELVTV